MVLLDILNPQIIRLHQLGAQCGRVFHCLFKIIALVNAQLNPDPRHVAAVFRHFITRVPADFLIRQGMINGMIVDCVMPGIDVRFIRL